jgi:hypothetical protein
MCAGSETYVNAGLYRPQRIIIEIPELAVWLDGILWGRICRSGAVAQPAPTRLVEQ